MVFNIKFLLCLFLLVCTLIGCSTINSNKKINPEQQWLKLWSAACPVSEGKGQIFLPKRTYAFSYDSAMKVDEKIWVISLEVPLRGEEFLAVPFDENKNFSGSLWNSLDKKTLNKIGVKTFKFWKKSWVSLIQFLEQRHQWSKDYWQQKKCYEKKCQGRTGEVEWFLTEDMIELKTRSLNAETDFSWKFQRSSDEFYFSKQTVTLRHQKNSQSISLHLYPSVCGK